MLDITEIINKKYSALAIGASVIVLLSIAHFSSSFSLFNGFSSDFLMRTLPSTQASKEIIVIEADVRYRESGDEVWLTVLNQLLEHDVKQIAFNFLPSHVSEQFYQLAVASGKVVFAANVTKSLEANDLVVQAFPPAVAQNDIAYGLISTIPSQQGIYRFQHSTIKANGIVFPSFEKRVAQQTLKNRDDLPDSDYRVNFIGAQDRIPKLRIKRVLTGGVVNELVSGRTVLVGLNRHGTLANYYTPISIDQNLTSEVMFHAFALDTLLSQRQINLFPSWAFVLLIIIITGLNLFLCQRLKFQMSLVVSIFMTVIFIISCWLALHVFSIWLPFVELFLAQWISFSLVWRLRVTQENEKLDQMLLGLSSKLREKVTPVSFYRTEEPWDQLISLINQSLNLNRFIFLERVKGDHRLKEIKAFNCNIDQIIEPRRDYERTPYSTAISENKPIIPTRTYLEKLEVEETQYLAPLIFAGEVLGFWAFSIEPGRIQSLVRFNALTSGFMAQISEILHYRQEWQKRMRTEQNKLWSYLRVEGGAEYIQQLNQSVTLLDKRVSELQEVFNNINTSCVVYDLFGRVLLVNKFMEDFVQSVGLRLFNMTMLDFIKEITGFDEDYAKGLLQKTIFDRELVSLPVTSKEIGSNFMLHMRPLIYDEKQDADEFIPDESNVFQISGVLCELIDMSKIKSLYQLKEQMFERFNYQIRNDFSSVLFGLSMLEDKQLPEETRKLVIDNTQDKINETLGMLDLVKEQIDVDVEGMISDTLLCYPVDGRKPLQKIISHLSEEIKRRNIALNLQLPKLISLVFASPTELETVLEAIMMAMITDTYDGGDIKIEVKEKDANVYYNIINSGVGISDNKLQELNKGRSDYEPEMLKFHYAIRCVNRWGGSLKISSKIGEGSKAELLLRKFM